QTSSVQESPSLHGSGTPPSHAPAWQLPVPWHASAAGQAVPSGCETLWHVAAARHRSAVHGLPSLQVGSVAATTHPVFGSHAPVRHGPAHWIVLLGTQAPFPPQRRSMPQTLPSSHGVPSGWSAQLAGSHRVNGALDESLPRVTIM